MTNLLSMVMQDEDKDDMKDMRMISIMPMMMIK